MRSKVVVDKLHKTIDILEIELANITHTRDMETTPGRWNSKHLLESNLARVNTT